ncbi:carotenoid biosynthesis protein [Rossellomorea sp. YZS02]|uniref:carotenoid biosynthesis protein n=1 Tax=Rossellomorea sp. YZS02 TaxID=3097358 RepID=UPI002A152B71|nr:carotenoid biosynthesis protein [Rossellomorea sp. YZS02]MDX8343776.1 carotenoid biosynthesis protein [Rossellomorea sp. YZS02]
MTKKWQDWIWIVFLIWYGVGVILVSLDMLPDALQWANAVFLYLAGFLAILYAIKKFRDFQGLIISLSIMLLTILAESLGVHYGFIFGSYHYERDFGIQMFGVPVTIGFAWVMVVFTSMSHFEFLLSRRKTVMGGVLYSSVTSLLAVTMDLIIDPVAYKGREYWVWDQGGLYYDIPTQNFLGWFFVSFFIQCILYVLIKQEMYSTTWSGRMRRLYFLVIFMFVVTAIVEGLWLAVMVTFVFYTVSLVIRTRMEKVA